LTKLWVLPPTTGVGDNSFFAFLWQNNQADIINLTNRIEIQTTGGNLLC